MEPSQIADETILEKHGIVSFKVKPTLKYNPVIALLDVYLRERKSYNHTCGIYINVIGAFFM